MERPTPPADPARRPRRTPSPSAAAPEYGPEDFPGCEPFHLPAHEIETSECRIELWDGRTHTAWRVSEPTTIQHEAPTRMLSRLAERFALHRGTRIECFGSADLVHRDPAGRIRWLMQADEVLYLAPERSLPSGPEIDVDRDPLPDVVLEVDYTTDVRRRKLAIYEEAGFPEVWVLMPAGSRRAGRPRVTIHVHDGAAYRAARESAALPGLTNDEVFRALTERPWSESTWRMVERVGRAIGEREGTRPEDDPHSRSLIGAGEARGRAAGYRKGRIEGHREGRAQGQREGRVEGNREARTKLVFATLRSRGIALSVPFAEAFPALAGDIPDDALMDAALACTSEADFRRRLRDAAG